MPHSMRLHGHSEEQAVAGAQDDSPHLRANQPDVAADAASSDAGTSTMNQQPGTSATEIPTSPPPACENPPDYDSPPGYAQSPGRAGAAPQASGTDGGTDSVNGVHRVLHITSNITGGTYTFGPNRVTISGASTSNTAGSATTNGGLQSGRVTFGRDNTGVVSSGGNFTGGTFTFGGGGGGGVSAGRSTNNVQQDQPRPGSFPSGNRGIQSIGNFIGTINGVSITSHGGVIDIQPGSVSQQNTADTDGNDDCQGCTRCQQCQGCQGCTRCTGC